MVQEEMRRRKRISHNYSGNNIFASKIICAECGGYYGPKVWHSNDKYRRVIYRCNRKYSKGEHKCGTPTLTEDGIKAAFITAFNLLIAKKQEVLEQCRYMQELLSDTTEIDAELGAAVEEMNFVKELLIKCVENNTQVQQNQEEFWNKYNILEERYNKAKARVEELQVIRKEREHKLENIGGFMFEIHERDDALDTFDERLWCITVETVKVQTDGNFTVVFKNGLEIVV